MIFFLVISPITSGSAGRPHTVPIATLQSDIAEQRVKQVEINDEDHQATVSLKDGHKYLFAYPQDYGDDLLNQLQNAHVPTNIVGRGFWQRYQLGIGIMAFLILIVVMLWFYDGSELWRKGGTSLRSSGVIITSAQRPTERFDDVGGADEVIEFFKQDVDALRDPERYRAFGVRPNAGTLLKGPPGTGKTLLARAIAGEAGVPFFAINGADILGRYLNDGPRAIASLFDQARQAAPSIIFFDEIDTVGSTRSSDDDSGSRELKNTLNQLLTELDGFGKRREAVLFIGATNRPDDLDPGLLRPGRLTRHADMPLPDKKARRKILDIHSRSMRLAADVDLDRVAQITSGMSGAELQSILNQAGLAVLREGNEANGITMADLMDAVATAEIGMARRSREVAERDRQITAIHESGHAVAALFTEGAPTPNRVTIIPRGPSGGHTGMHDEEDWLYLTTGQMKARLIVSMAGRAAEKLLLDGDFTTGAETDIANATDQATYMVCSVAMGGKFTARMQLDAHGHDPRLADVTAEIDKLVKDAEAEALAVLTRHRQVLEALRDELLDVETIDGDSLKERYSPANAT